MIDRRLHRAWVTLATVLLLAAGTAACDLTLPVPPSPPLPQPSPPEPSPQPSPSPSPSPTEMPTESDTVYPVPDGALFVAPGGSDGAAGTQDAPLATLGRALEEAAAGGTVVLRGGMYREGDLLITKPLTVQPYPGEQVRLRGSDVLGGFRAEGGVWVKDGWTTTFPLATTLGCDPDHCLDEEYPEADHREMVFVDGQPLRQVLSRAAVEDGTFFVGGGQLVLGADPAGGTVEATVRDGGLQVNARGAGTVIRGLHLAHYAGAALEIYGPGSTVEGTVAEYNAVQGAELQGADHVVRNSIFRHNGRVGLTGWTADRLLLEGNTFEANNAEHFARTWSAAGAKIARTKHVRVIGNRFLDNDATGLWLDIGADDAVMIRNHARGNVIGLFFEISRGALIASNVAEGNNVGVMIANSADAQVWNNTLVANDANITVKQGARVFDGEDAAVVTKQVSGTVVRNNLLSAAEGPQISAQKAPCNGPEMFSAVNTNGYHASGRVARWTGPGGVCEAIYDTLGAFRSATGNEAGGSEFAAGAPMFTDPAAGDYRLVAGSPARGAGAPLPAAIAEALGRSSGAGVDLGALHLDGSG